MPRHGLGEMRSPKKCFKEKKVQQSGIEMWGGLFVVVGMEPVHTKFESYTGQTDYIRLTVVRRCLGV